MTIDQLGLYNGAVRIMGERKLANLTENRESRRVLDGIWGEDAIKYCLEQGMWGWASRTVKLDASTTITPEFGFSYVFEKPDDFVRTIEISADEYFSVPLNTFNDEAGFISANVDVIYIRYVSDDAQYGRDYSLWPQTFIRYFMSYLAYEGSLRLTASHSIQDRCEKLMKVRLSDAQSKDGIGRPVKFPPHGTFALARSGRNSSFSPYRRR